MNTLDSIITHYQPQGRAGLLPALQAAQVLDGWLSREAITAIAQGLGVPLAEAYGTLKFYSMLYDAPVGRQFVRVCDDVMCRIAGSRKVLGDLETRLGVSAGQTTADGAITLETVTCLGACHRAIAVLAGDTLYEEVTGADDVLADGMAPPRNRHAPPTGPHLLRDMSLLALHHLRVALEQGRYQALRKALSTPPEQIVAEVKAAGLVGRGGAAFPTGVKWEGARREIAAREPGPGGVTGYIVLNGDESETGTFKDRLLMERDPHRLVEAMAIAGVATGANRGFIYVRGEYPLALARIRESLDEARAEGLLGRNLLGSGIDFDIELRSGAGAYVCGEETALFESIEGKRGEPRVKPPFPTERGLFGRPTVINNVETLANVPGIVSNGASWYRQWGTAQSPGTRLVCLSGTVRRPGLYEISMGLPLRDLIFDLGDGMRAGHTLRAVLVGGAAGAFLTPDQLDVALDFQSLSAAGATFGSGAVMVFDDSVDLWSVLGGITHFFAHESCGKCYPCQLGTWRQMEIVERLSHGDARGGDEALLRGLGQTMKDASLCGLGQAAANALLSAFDRRLVHLPAGQG
ncbi:MAG: NAD(P)H-dependent oxidoreductase subunit E [Chloroflexi bacterium]|nr:NAD(P)H-dependent oxidoreductase subunit E [Chloroflexota bacterium]